MLVSPKKGNARTGVHILDWVRRASPQGGLQRGAWRSRSGDYQLSGSERGELYSVSITHFVRTKKGREGIKPSLPRNKKTVQPGGWLNGVDDKDGLRANRIEGTLLRALNPGVMEGIDRATEEVTLAFHHPTRRAKSPMHIRSESYQFLGAGSGFTCPLMRSLSSQRQKTS